MELRKFYAANMRDAMDLVRLELGEDAVILDTRTIREAADAGQAPVERVEIWAHLPGSEAVAIAPPPRTPDVPVLPEEADQVEFPAATAEIVLPEIPRADETLHDGGLQELKTQIESIHAQLAVLSDGMQWLGMAPLGTSGELALYVADMVAQKTPVSGGIRLGDGQHVVALVGPTGVGKTTMIAKLAWHFTLWENRTVGIISTDTLRIGASEQIRLCCQHMGLPLEVVYAPTEMPEALAKLADCALVLVDTPGGSQRDQQHLTEVHQLLQAADPAEVHLVLSATASSAVNREVIQRFAHLHPDQVMFTKLDETPSLLEALPLVLGSGLAVSYVSAGSAIPTDLNIADPTLLARYIVGE